MMPPQAPQQHHYATMDYDKLLSSGWLTERYYILYVIVNG